MVCQLPCCFRDRLSFSKDEVLKLVAEETRVKNLVDNKFLFVQEFDWWWRRRVMTRDFR
jgi:hypothetical protein